jgi:hypothetical protein
METLCEQSGPLDESHRFDLETPEKLDDLGTETESHEVFCPKCVEGADETCWEQDLDGVEVETEDDEFFVRCHGCDREVEFGWSHSGRGGRIWPVECADFNPWLSWPESRYIESWHTKGWLRPIEATAVAEKIERSLEETEHLIRTGLLAKHPKSKELATDSFGLDRFLYQHGRPGEQNG